MSTTKAILLGDPSPEEKRETALAAARRYKVTPDALLSGAWCLGPVTYASAARLLAQDRVEPAKSDRDRTTRERNKAKWLARELVNAGVFDQNVPEEDDAP